MIQISKNCDYHQKIVILISKNCDLLSKIVICYLSSQFIIKKNCDKNCDFTISKIVIFTISEIVNHNKKLCYDRVWARSERPCDAEVPGLLLGGGSNPPV